MRAFRNLAILLLVFAFLGSPMIGVAGPTLSNVVFKINSDTTLSAKSFDQYGELEEAVICNDASGMVLQAGNVSHADGFFPLDAAIAISLQLPAECRVTNFTCSGRIAGITNHWPVLADVNFSFYSKARNETLTIAAPCFVFSPFFVTNLTDFSVNRIFKPAPLGVSAGLEFQIDLQRKRLSGGDQAMGTISKDGAGAEDGLDTYRVLNDGKASATEDGGCLFLFRNLNGVLCKERRILGQDRTSGSIETIFDLMGAASSNLSSQVSFEKIPIRSGDIAYFASDSQLARWRDDLTAEFEKGKSLFDNICDNIFYSSLSRQPPLFECQEGALRMFKAIEHEKGREDFFFNLVMEGTLTGEGIQTNKFSVEVQPEDGEVECIRMLVFIHPDTKSYTMIAGCKRKLESVNCPQGRLYFPLFDNTIADYDCNAVISYDGKEVGSFTFSLCSPLFFKVNLDIP